MAREDLKHIGELGDLKDTKYWFKRDVGTIKNSFRKSMSVSPFLLLGAFVLSLLYNYFYDTISLLTIITSTISFFLILLVSYILLYVIVKKGYNVHSRGGTTLDSSRFDK